jgi:probable addiction module antidote protein
MRPVKKARTSRWDAADHLHTEEDIAAYFDAVFEDGDPQLIAHALGDFARAKGMSVIARKSGLGRESLYKALSPQGNPELATVLRVLSALGIKALGIKLRTAPALHAKPRPVGAA